MDDDKFIVSKCLIDQMIQNINKLMSKQSSHPKEETVTPSTNMENSDSDLDINIVDVMDNDNQLDPSDQSDPSMTHARVRIFVHKAKTSTPDVSLDEPVDTSSPKVLPDISNVKVELKKSGRTRHDYTDQPVDLPDLSDKIDTDEHTKHLTMNRQHMHQGEIAKNEEVRKM